jgi:hypothetical protein
MNEWALRIGARQMAWPGVLKLYKITGVVAKYLWQLSWEPVHEDIAN